MQFGSLGISSTEFGERWRIATVKVTGKGLPKGTSPNLKAGDTVDCRLLEDNRISIKRFLQERGFLWSEVKLDTMIESDRIKVHYQVNLQKPARIARWLINGQESIPEQALTAVLPKRGAIFTTKALRRSVKDLIKIYEKKGFPFVTVTPTGIRESTERENGAESGWVYPVLTIQEGPKVKINFVTFTGAKKTAENLLLRYAGFKKGTVYSGEVINLWRKNLEKSGWLKVDSEDLVVGPEESYGIRFYISEKLSSEFYATIGYLSEEKRLVGWAGIKLLNLLQSGRTLAGEWRSTFQRAHYQLSYTEPWVLGSPVNITGFAKHEAIDTTFAFTILSLTAMTRAKATDFQLGWGIERVAGLVNAQTVWLSTGFVFDNRDPNRFRGLLGRLETRVGNRNKPSEGLSILGRMEGDFCPILPIGGKFSLLNNYSVRMVFSRKELTPPELYQVGGMGNVRGYREGWFITTRMGWWNCELRYHFPRRSILQLFADVGVYEKRTADARSVWTPIAGYGIGGRWRTKIATVGIDYGVPIPESPLEGKVHISFAAEF
ncbi:MAG: POTRA domain-containing protein [candidate division WOR-3 bacterium]